MPITIRKIVRDTDETARENEAVSIVDLEVDVWQEIHDLILAE